MQIQECMVAWGYQLILSNQKDIEVFEKKDRLGHLVLMIHKEKLHYSTELIIQIQNAMKNQFDLRGIEVISCMTWVIEEESTYLRNRDLEATALPYWIIQLDKGLIFYPIGSPHNWQGIETKLQDYLTTLPKKNLRIISRETFQKKESLRQKEEGVTHKEDTPRQGGIRSFPPSFYHKEVSKEDLKGRTSNVRSIPKPLPSLCRYKKKLSIITAAMLVTNILVFLYLEYKGSTSSITFMLAHGAANAATIQSTGNYLPIVQSIFMHFGIVHLFNNMIALAYLGNILEKGIGHISFLLVYVLGGLAGSFASYRYSLFTQDNYVSAGASGCIFAIVGALLYIVLRNKGKFEDVTITRLGLMIFFTLYTGVVGAGIDSVAHLGGLVAGFIVGILVYRKRRKGMRKRRR